MSSPERSDRPEPRAKGTAPDQPGSSARPGGAENPGGLSPASAERAGFETPPGTVRDAASLPPEVSDPAAAAAVVPGETDHDAEQGVSPSAEPEARPRPDAPLPPPARAGRLAFGVLGAPLMWGIQMQALYTLGTMACGDTAAISLHLVSLFALLVAAAGALVSWRAWRAVGPEWPPDEGDIPDRARFVALAGLLGSAGFFLLILAQAIPTFVFPICR